MPSIRDISVHIIDSHGIQLDEWGVQHLRTQESQDKVSAYVKSESDMAFSIVIEAKIPYTDYNPDVTISEDPERMHNRYGRKSELQLDSYTRSPADILQVSVIYPTEDE